MADNVTIPATGSGTATPVIATDDVGGVQYQRVKLDVGADGATTPVVGTLPVSGTVTATGPLTDTQLRATAVPVSLATAPTTTVTGTVTANAGTNLNTSLLALDATVGTTNTEVGGLTEAAPATDTASSGLNGRLQRIAQRLTTIIGLLPTALGAGGGLKVDGSGTALPVSGTVTATVGTVTAVTSITNVVHVDDNAGSLTVDGTVAATQSGTWNVTNVSGTVSLPTGAATAAKQPALGTAGTASADVITVQGVASAYPVAVGLNQLNISQTPTVSTSPAYTAGDALGGLLTFANAARVSGLSGIIAAVTILCKTPALVPAIDIYLFNQTFTASSDNAAFAPSDSDMANCVGVISIAAWAAETASSVNSIATRFALAFPYTLTGTSLFGQMVTRTAFTAGGTTDFVIGLQVWRD